MFHMILYSERMLAAQSQPSTSQADDGNGNETFVNAVISQLFVLPGQAPSIRNFV